MDRDLMFSAQCDAILGVSIRTYGAIRFCNSAQDGQHESHMVACLRSLDAGLYIHIYLLCITTVVLFL